MGSEPLRAKAMVSWCSYGTTVSWLENDSSLV